jgi:hypothetical protein
MVTLAAAADPARPSAADAARSMRGGAVTGLAAGSRAAPPAPAPAPPAPAPSPAPCAARIGNCGGSGLGWVSNSNGKQITPAANRMNAPTSRRRALVRAAATASSSPKLAPPGPGLRGSVAVSFWKGRPMRGQHCAVNAL